MPIKQAEMKAIADAAVALRDLYLGDFAQLGVLRSMQAESGGQAHLEALLETLDRLCWSAEGATAQHMLVVERYLERYRLTAAANAANAERKRRARAKLAMAGTAKHQQEVKQALAVLQATSQGELTDEEWAALQEFNTQVGFTPPPVTRPGQTYTAGRVTREVEFPPGAEEVQPQPAAPGMSELPDLAEGEEEDEI
jgi:hypothetical protein